MNTPSPLAPEDVFELLEHEDDTEFRAKIKGDTVGIVLASEKLGSPPQMQLKADAGHFAKWINKHESRVKVELPQGEKLLVLRSSEIWLPLAYLATDVALPIYLGIVSNYLYDKMKGALKNDKPRIHLSAIFEDKSNGIIKQFNFSGDHEALKSAIQRFDLNRFLDESKP